MRNKKALSISFVVVSTLAIGVAIYAATNKNNIKPLSVGAVQPGSIVIDVNDPNINLEMGYTQVESQAGNTFSFSFQGITKENGYFKMSKGGAYFNNHDLLNGLTELRFLTPNYSQKVRIGHALNYDTSLDFDEYTVDENEYPLIFVDYNPGRFYLETSEDDDFYFSRLTISYGCVADTPTFDIYHIGNNRTVEGYQVNVNDSLFIPTGDNLSSISLTNCYITVKSGKGFNVYNDNINNLSITYNESPSTVAIEGRYLATVSFTYGGATYTSDEIYIIGYDHVGYVLDDFYLADNQLLKQSSDVTIPNAFNLSSYGDLKFYDSSDNVIDYCDSNARNIAVTEDMIVSSDSDRFTGLGQHNMTITYQGLTKSVKYTVYDPTINNIRDLNFQGQLELDKGASLQDFIDLIASSTFFIGYYDMDLAQDLPNFVTLTADNFDLTAGMFDNAGDVEVPVHYSTFNGIVTVHVHLVKGNLLHTYTNQDGVSVFGDLIYEIAIYDNYTCEFDPGPNSEVFAYTIDGNIITVSFHGMVDIKFVLDDSNYTFDKYSSSGNLVVTLATNFHPAFDGAPDQYVYSAYIYDDYTIVFDMGMEIATTFTIDPVDSNIIYFEFMSTPCYGVIDTVNTQLTVYLVS